MAAPTHERGHAGGGAWTLGQPYDPSEENQKLQWPESVRIYDRMRRSESQLRAVLNAIGLPIRRTQWVVDPNGAPEERVAMLADDLGLPLKGSDAPVVKRRKGFKFQEHIRMALLSLPYGHMPFEIAGEVRDDEKWHLIRLAERMPPTILHINTNRDGTLDSIEQYPSGAPGDTGPTIPIPGDSLLFYSHEREGGMWQGQSILRSAYRPFVLKDRLIRVDALKHERNGMGIPTLSMPDGATQAAQDQAAKITSQMRAGEYTGGATPHGSELKLVGVTGTLPDTIASITYHDQQMAREALAQFLDLVTSSHGSRALATSMIDFFIMSLQAAADELADTFNSQFVERWHEWNWDDDESIPFVQPGAIGDDHSYTAEGLAALVTAGAIQPDPLLDSFLRANYRMPMRDAVESPWVSHDPAAPAATVPGRVSARRAFDYPGDPDPKE